MKRLFALILALGLCLSCSACGIKPADSPTRTEAATTVDNRIQLTLYNYEKYLNVATKRSLSKVERYNGVFITGICYYVDISGVSTNFNYRDVVVTVEFTALSKHLSEYSSDKEKITLNIAGDGTLEERCYLNEEIPEDLFKMAEAMTGMVDITIVDISGYLEPV